MNCICNSVSYNNEIKDCIFDLYKQENKSEKNTQPNITIITSRIQNTIY